MKDGALMAMPIRYPRVLIAGGGIGGLAAALALLERGIDVDREWSEERVKQRYEWRFTHDVTAVAA